MEIKSVDIVNILNISHEWACLMDEYKILLKEKQENIKSAMEMNYGNSNIININTKGLIVKFEGVHPRSCRKILKVFYLILAII